MPDTPGRAFSLGITSLSLEIRERIENSLGHGVQWHGSYELDTIGPEAREVTELLVALPVKLDRATFERMPSLRFVGVLGTSTSNLDMAAAVDAGVSVASVQHYCDEETAEFTTALLLGGLRGVLFPSLGTDSLRGTRVGLVGLGQVGSIVTHQMDALGAEVIPIRRTDSDRAKRIASCQAISLHGPRDVQVFGPEDIEALRSDAGLVNTSNGTVLDEAALAQWLGAGSGWVALDAVAARTYGHLQARAPQRVFVSPRSAYQTPAALARLADQFAANVEAWVHKGRG